MHWTPTEYRNAATGCDSPVLAETCMAAFSQCNSWRYCFSIFPVTIPKDRTLLSPFPRWKMSAKSEQTSLVFVNIKSRMHQAISQLKHITNVESVTPVTGSFDVVIRLRTNDPDKAFNAVEKIREIDDVTATQTGLPPQHVSSPHEGEREKPIAFALMKVKG